MQWIQRGRALGQAVKNVQRHRQIIAVFAKHGFVDIVDRMIAVLADEGARLLDEGIAARASDIDLVYLTGYGFPRARGGPMFHVGGAR
jgi:3-hydroxyacyl-CoA dehydrogenase